MAIPIPTIHMNGTSRGELEHQLRSAIMSLHNARIALSGTSPNGRDYYPQGNEAIQIADRAHMARLEKLDEVVEELRAIWDGIQEQGRK
jgi:hypothetical protein